MIDSPLVVIMLQYILTLKLTPTLILTKTVLWFMKNMMWCHFQVDPYLS